MEMGRYSLLTQCAIILSFIAVLVPGSSRADDPPDDPPDTAPLPANDAPVFSPPISETETAPVEPAPVEAAPIAEGAPIEAAPAPPEEYSTTIARTPYNPRQPRFQTVRPQWGIEFQWGYNPFGGQNIAASQTGKLTSGTLQIEFQPAFIQGIGVLGLGPSFSIYPNIGGSFTSSPAAIWSVGGQVRYQMRWFREQPIVPIVGYAFEYFRYNLADGNNGYIQAMGPMFGIWLYLNSLDPESAAEFYASFNGTRSYLVAEAKLLSGQDDLITLSGMGFYFGFRLEFE